MAALPTSTGLSNRLPESLLGQETEERQTLVDRILILNAPSERLGNGRCAFNVGTFQQHRAGDPVCIEMEIGHC